jgi:predicted transcriptional regulator YheO
MKFTKEDNAILKTYENLTDCIAVFLGNHCEVALYSNENKEGKLIKIVNGHHTKREKGSKYSEQGLQILTDFQEKKSQINEIYTTSDSKGNPMRSVFYVIENKNKILGLLDINFNMNIPLAEFISTFSLFKTPENIKISTENTIDSQSVENLIHKAVNDIVIEISTDISIPNHEKNKYIVYGLYEKGIFDIKGSVVMVAKELKLSKYTIYSYIRELKEKNNG